MLNSSELQMHYNDLYCALREYIWDIQIVTYIADLEVATYEKFPDVADIKRKLMFLKSRISSSVREDEKRQKAFEKFEDCVNSDNIELYSRIEKPQEVISL